MPQKTTTCENDDGGQGRDWSSVLEKLNEAEASRGRNWVVTENDAQGAEHFSPNQPCRSWDGCVLYVCVFWELGILGARGKGEGTEQ